jgi:hypothetical protein
MPSTAVTQKQKTQTDQSVEPEEDLLLNKREDEIKDPIQEVLEDPVTTGPVTAEDTSVSNSEKEEEGGSVVADVASRLASAITEKEDKLEHGLS